MIENVGHGGGYALYFIVENTMQKCYNWKITGGRIIQIYKLYGIVLEENIASHKVLEKNGFKLVFKGIDKYQGEDRELRKYIFER